MMAEILIKGMEMPKTCRRCLEMEIPVRCRVKEQEPATAVMIGYNRPSDCPLVEVPPHGRLGDLDALEESLEASDEDIYTKHILWDAPTIIEASKERE